MTDKKTEALKLALEYLRDNQHYIADNERHAYVMEYNAFVERLEALAEQPAQQQCMEHGECFGGECIYPAPQPAQDQGQSCYCPECERLSKELDAIKAQQPEPPPECQTEAEKTAFAFGWWKALESARQQPERPAVQGEPVNKYCCHTCFNKSGQMFLDRMILCPECGNKRCPKATHHELPCTNSNEPGQAGSIYTTPQPAVPNDILREVTSLLEDAVNDHIEGGNEPSEWLDFSQRAIAKARAMLATPQQGETK